MAGDNLPASEFESMHPQGPSQVECVDVSRAVERQRIDATVPSAVKVAPTLEIDDGVAPTAGLLIQLHGHGIRAGGRYPSCHPSRAQHGDAVVVGVDIQRFHAAELTAAKPASCTVSAPKSTVISWRLRPSR